MYVSQLHYKTNKKKKLKELKFDVTDFKIKLYLQTFFFFLGK